MPIQYFGQYLMQHHLITREQLLAALYIQDSTHKRMGVLAIDKSYLTASQVEHILHTQKNVNKLFGQIAIDLNMLTLVQLEDLLSSQKADHVLFGEALVETGALTLQQLEVSLKGYRSEQIQAEKAIDAAFSRLPTEYVNAVNLGTNLVQNTLMRMTGMHCKISAVEKSPAQNRGGADYFSYQAVTGDLPVTVGMALKETQLLKISGNLVKRKLTKVDELAKDGIQEILNLVAGYMCSVYSNAGKHADTLPPHSLRMVERGNLFADHIWVRVQLCTAEDWLDIYFIFPPQPH